MARLALLLACAAALAPRSAAARATMDLGYRLDEVFSVAQRFVRVDRGCKITDKDADAAYVMFECSVDEKHTSRGALEIFRAQVRGHDGVRIQVTLADEPHGAELRLVELLERKLREERGAPAPPPRAPNAPTDGGVR